MKKLFRTIAQIVPLLLLTLINPAAKAQENSINLTIANDIQLNSKQLEFDLLLFDPDASQDFQEATVQAGITLNPAIYNGGTITCAILDGTSDLNTLQKPLSVTFNQSTNTVMLASNPPEGCGAGTIISKDPVSRTRICRLRLTNSNDWTNNSVADLTFCFTTSPYPTKISLYQSSDCINIAAPVSITNVYSDAANLPLLYIESNKTINLKLFLEGLYAPLTGLMNQAQGASGPQFGAGVADQVTIELHDATAPYAIAHTYSNVNLNTNGTLSISNIPGTVSGSYYLVIKHRNSIETWSTLPVSFAGSSVSYDFSTSDEQAYSSNMRLIGSVYAIYGGEASLDGIVDGSDMSEVFNASKPPALAGYNNQDVNGDGIVDSSDMSMIYNNSKPPAVTAKRP
jgi:hypothetical protein